MDAVTTPMTPAPIAIPGRTRDSLSFWLAKWCLPFPHERDPVDLHAVDPHFVVQMASGRCPCLPHSRDGLPGAEVVPDADHGAAAADVRISGVDSAAHRDTDEMAVRAVRTGVDHGAVVRGVDGRV